MSLAAAGRPRCRSRLCGRVMSMPTGGCDKEVLISSPQELSNVTPYANDTVGAFSASDSDDDGGSEIIHRRTSGLPSSNERRYDLTGREYGVSPRRWWMLTLLCLATCMQSAVWLTWSTVTDQAAVVYSEFPEYTFSTFCADCLISTPHDIVRVVAFMIFFSYTFALGIKM